MNYHHVFHAGNICDCVKHAVLTRLLLRLRSKDSPFCVLDSHAGAGSYDLCDSRALKTKEFQAGIVRLLAAGEISSLGEYLDIVRGANAGGDGLLYPGSPLIVRKMLRGQDRLVACELHPEEALDLRRLFRGDKQAHIHERDGYQALDALLPPKEKRGLVLIDPPFEKPDEFQRLSLAAQVCSRRFPQGIVLIWFPIKDRPAIWKFNEALEKSGLPKLLRAEFVSVPETGGNQLCGSGFVIINSPWDFEKEIAALFQDLHVGLQTDYQGDAIY